MQPLVIDLAGSFVSDSPVLGGLRCRVAHSFDSFKSERNTWESLRDQMGESAYLDWNYLETWWSVFAKDCAFLGVIVYDRDLVVGIFPLFCENRSRLGVRLRRLRQVGYNGDLAAADMTEEPLSVVKPGFEQAAYRALLEYVEGLLAEGAFDCAELRGLFFGSEKLRSMAKGRVVRFRACRGSQIVELPESWEAYRASLSKSMRDNLPYYPRLLTRHHPGWQVRMLREGMELEEAARDLVRLQKMRVHGSYGRAHIDHFPTEVQESFLSDACARLGPEGKASIGVLEIDGQVVAAQAYLESDRELVIWYGGFDPKWYRFGPVFVLEAEAMRRALERGIRRVNLLQGGAPWQLRWKPSAPNGLTTMVVAGKSVDGFLRTAVWFSWIGLIKEVRRWSRRRSDAKRLRAGKQCLPDVSLK